MLGRRGLWLLGSSAVRAAESNEGQTPATVAKGEVNWTLGILVVAFSEGRGAWREAARVGRPLSG